MQMRDWKRRIAVTRRCRAPGDAPRLSVQHRHRYSIMNSSWWKHSDQQLMLVRPCFTCEMPLRLRLQMRDDAGPCGSDQGWLTPNRT
ncbi:hypothetical protein KC356_g182 [Hortaea werneckii]|nr:hypothetical protein KC356_g182 [Hortaea werneckii]